MKPASYSIKTHPVWPSPALKPIVGSLAALAFLACGTAQAGANILSNPYLDEVSISSQNRATPTEWIVEATKTISGPFFDGASSETWCNVLQPDGFGLFFKPFQGNQPENDLLTVHLYQDNPATAGEKFTLSGYAAGEANYSGFFTTNEPAPATLFVVQFLDSAGTVLASNALDLVAAGLPASGPGSMVQFFMDEVTAPPSTATVRAGASILNTYNTTGAQSFFVDAFELTSIAPPGAPVITNQPGHATVSPGGTVMFSVGVSNAVGVTYQWQFNGVNLANGGRISGADQATLTITGASSADVGRYRVVAANAVGSATSQEASLAVFSINLYPVILITGRIGDTYRLDYATRLDPATWIPLSTNVLSNSPQLVVDTTSPGSTNRFYQAVFVP